MTTPSDKIGFAPLSTPGCQHRRSILALAIVAACLGSSSAQADNPKPVDAISLELVGVDEQLQNILNLFHGARQPNPAATLAAWKQARGGKASLGKATEAAIAILNPEMIPEVRKLNQTRIEVGFQPASGQIQWRATIPEDDGTFEAFATAIAITDGTTVEPLRGQPVRRLGPPSAPLSVAFGKVLAFASDRDQLETAIASLESPARPSAQSGLAFSVDPKGFDVAKTLNGRRIGEGLQALGALAINGAFRIEGDGVAVDCRTTLDRNFSPDLRKVDPAWLVGLPAGHLIAGLATVIDNDPKSLDRAFAIADRIEKADPTRTQVAPLRLRINLLARASGIQPETEIWPKLIGISIALADDDHRGLTRVVLGLHTATVQACQELAQNTLPKLLKTGKAEPIQDLFGFPVAFTSRDKSVWIGLGDGALEACVNALDGKAPSLKPTFDTELQKGSPRHLGAFWPSNARTLWTGGVALENALAQAPPCLWRSDIEGNVVHDQIRYGKFDDIIRNWLDALPLTTPPDRPAL